MVRINLMKSFALVILPVNHREHKVNAAQSTQRTLCTL